MSKTHTDGTSPSAHFGNIYINFLRYPIDYRAMSSFLLFLCIRTSKRRQYSPPQSKLISRQVGNGSITKISAKHYNSISF